MVATAGGTGAGTAPSGWFPFVLTGGDAGLGIADVSFLNDAPAGRDGPVTIRDGHFMDGQGRRVRFFGANLTATACFPEPAAAPKLAKRLRALGFNLVRLHFMDIGAPDGLFQPDGVTIDAGQLDRLDRLVAALKAEGVYVNLNLHVARLYPGIDEAAAKRFGMGKVLDRFYPPFIELHRKYARDLLAHVNPYTQAPYTREPAVLCVELNNENTLLPFWGGGPRDLPEPFAGELARQWQAWLKSTYGTTAALRAAWGSGARPAGPEMLRNGGAAAGTTGWETQAAGGAEARLSAIPSALRWEALKSGTEDWNLQLMQTGLEIRAGTVYELSFRARSEAPLDLGVSVMLNEEPWTGLGFESTVALTPGWKRFSFRFAGMESKGPRGRLNFSTGNRTGVVELAAVSLRTAELAGMGPDESLEAGRVSLRENGTPAVTLDWWRFLVDTERATTRGLVTYLKKDLGLRAPVADTQASYGGAAGVLRETALCDFIDMHAYWEHPDFPGSSWDPGNWRIPNTSQVRSPTGGELAGLAFHRVDGRPFTVSEYNIPTPNDHGAETLPMLAAIAAFQDWDAICAYTFLDFKTAWDADHLLGYFDFAGHPGKLVFAPAAALAFRRVLVAPGGPPVLLDLPRDGAARLLAEGRAGVEALWEAAGVPGGAVSVRRTAIRIAAGGAPVRVSATVTVGAVRTSDTRELEWAPGGKAYTFRVSAPAFRMAAGTLGGTHFRLGDVGLEFGSPATGYACISIVALDGLPVAESERLLVSVAGRVENQGMGWNADRTTVGRAWGHGPTVAEPVPVLVILPGRNWTAKVLGGNGLPAGGLRVQDDGRSSRVRLNAAGTAPSLWFLLARMPRPQSRR